MPQVLRRHPKNSADLIRPVKNKTPKEWGEKLNGKELAELRDIPANLRYPDELLDEVKKECAAGREAIELARTMKDYSFGLRV